jgi:hypothetical protein
MKNTLYKMFSTNDKIIRRALLSILDKDLKKYRSENDRPAELFEEFGVQHGTSRIDIAVINGVMHGYEIKSDCDTLERLPEQMNEFNAVFDKITLVVGKRHLYKAMHIVPDWWGVMLAKVDTTKNRVVFNTIREPEINKKQVGISIARLLWREEALQILEERNSAKGVRSKPRELIYERLVNILEAGDLKERVSNLLTSR